MNERNEVEDLTDDEVDAVAGGKGWGLDPNG